MKRFLTAAIFYCTISLQLISNTNPTDSLLNKIGQTHGKKKLQLMEIYAKQEENKELTAKQSAKDLINEAQKQSDVKYLTKGYEILSRAYANERDVDSLLYCISVLNDLGDEFQSGDPYMYLTHIYMNQGYYGLAMHNLKIMQKKAEKHGHPFKNININQLFSMAYRLTGKPDLGEEYAMKMIEQTRMLMSDQAPNRVIGLYESAISALAENKKYEEALKVCKEFEEWIEKYSTDTEQYDDCRYLIYSEYALIYIKMENKEKAKLYIDKMKALPTDNIKRTAIPLIHIVQSNYYTLIGDYSLALKHLETAMEYYNGIGMRDTASGLKYDKINILEKQNKYKDAFLLHKELSQRNDSMYQENVPLQIEKLTAGFELEKVKMQEAKAKAELESKQILIAGLAILLLLICFILFMQRRNNRKLKEKNKVLFKQNKDLSKQHKESTKLVVLAKEIIGEEAEKLDQELSLFNRIETYMQEEEPFRNPNLTREDLARALNTNRQYLTEEIKAATGKTFFDYINNYRLHYAHRQVVVDESLRINTIIIQSGFSSDSTFYRLFKEEFGMSPSELRQVKKDLEKGTEQADDNEIKEG